MNEQTTQPGGTDQPTGPSRPTGQDGIARFFGWIRSTGIVRSDERWFTGVAGGIAAKAGIDPIIVRGIFVVLAVLGGPGILLYLAGWLLLPDQAGRIHAEEVVRGRSSTGVIVAVVLLSALVFLPVLFGLLPGLFVGSWGWNAWGVMPDWLQLVFGVLWWAVIFPGLIVWLIIWLSRRSSGTRPGGSGGGPAASYGGPAGSQGGDAGDIGGSAPGWEQRVTDQAQQFSQQAEDWGRKAEATANDWSRKAEHHASEWERKAKEYQAAHRLGAGYVVISLALALLTGGAIALIALGNGADTNLTVTLGLIGATALLALSMIVAGIRGRDSGWVGFLAFCGAVTIVFAPFSTLLPEDTEVVPFGTSTIRAASAGEERALVTLAGNTTVDLSNLGRTAAGSTIEVWQLAGKSTVIMPSNTPTSVRVEVLGGSIQDSASMQGQRQQGGVFLSRSFQQNVAGVPDEDVANVQIRLLGGSVTIER